MRTFIAIELPEEIKNSLARLQEELKSSGADVKWVEPKNIHLTLKFLGEIEDNKCERVAGAIEDITAEIKPFYIRLASLGAFPKMNFPRVIWVGMDKGDLEAKKIADRLEEVMSKIGIPKEDRPFSSHITIGRVRSPLNRDRLVNALGNLTYNFSGIPEFKVTKITFFKSTLMPKGPVYEALKEINLETN
jgi:2'-5' RNA ligase